MLGLSAKHIARFKTFPKWWKWPGLSMSEWIDMVDWEIRTFIGTPSAKLVNTNNSNRDH